MSEWLDLELAHHLAPAAAPDGLWDRIQERRATVRGTPRVWPIAAILTFMAAAGALWMVAKGQEPAVDFQQLAMQELRETQPLELRSTDPAEIRAWIHRHAGVDVPLPAAPSNSVRLVGARLINQHGLRIGMVAYRVGGAPAALLIARTGDPVDTRHGRLMWRTGGQVYALASDIGRPEAACVLCHTSL